MKMTARKPNGARRRLVAKVGVLAMLVGGMVALTAVAAGADAPTATSNGGVAVNNGDGTVTVTVGGTWDWGTPTDCDTGGRIVGWAVDWNDPDQAGYPLGANPFDVGVAEAGLNPVDPQATSVTIGGVPCPATWGPLTHTYSIADIPEGGISPCVVLYDVRDDVSTGNHSRIAGGTGYNGDNSVDDPHSGPDGVCASIEVPQNPDVKIVKTGPDAAVVGQPFTYDLTATNTGVVPVPDAVITDQLPGNVTFVSATSPCTFDQGTDTVTCDVGSLDIDQSVTVHITVIPTSATAITNTAVVTPVDDTPADNSSTWVIDNVTVSPDTTVKPVPVPVQPQFPG
jgi:uncharacterized repeat protein (TIGR01451 family)